MRVKRTSWANYGHYMKPYILLGGLQWLIYGVILYDSDTDMAHSINSTLIVMTHAESLVLTRGWCIVLIIVPVWVIPNILCTHDDSFYSMPFHPIRRCMCPATMSRPCRVLVRSTWAGWLWVQGFSGSMVQWFRGEHSSSKETEVERESLGLQVKDNDKTEV